MYRLEIASPCLANAPAESAQRSGAAEIEPHFLAENDIRNH